MPATWNGQLFGLLSAILACGTASVCQPQPDAQPALTQTRVSERDLQRLIEIERGRLDERDRRIVAELAGLDRATLADGDWAKEWAGTYYTGDGLGMNVTIKLAPKAGVAYTWHGCMGLYDANHGDIVEPFNDGVVVRMAINTQASIYSFMSEKLYFVRWGERRYLVPEAKMLQLINNYNEGGYARREMYSIPLRFEEQVERTHRTEPPGRPQLPPEYARLIIEKPLRLKISKVTSQPPREVTPGVEVTKCAIEFEGGQDQGVFIGMEMPFECGRTSGKIRIDLVNATSATGTLSLYAAQGETLELPIVGRVLSFPGAKPDELVAPQSAAKKPG